MAQSSPASARGYRRVRRALVTSPFLSRVTSYLPSTSVVVGTRWSSSTSRVTFHSRPSFSTPVTASTGRPIRSCTCCAASSAISRSGGYWLERFPPEELPPDRDDDPRFDLPPDLDDP